MIENKALFFFQGNPQSSDLKPDFWNSFTKQTQQFLCTSNAQLKGPGTKKAKKEQWNRHKLSCTNHERTINNSTKTEQKVKKYDTHPLLCHPNLCINEPPSNLCITPSFAVTTKWLWYPWHKWGNLMDVEV